MAQQIQIRRDTAANWASANPVPAQGELCYETDTGVLKIGDGSSTYGILAEFTSGGGGGGATNLSWIAATSVVASSTGTDATLTVVDGSNPGLMAPLDKVKLDAITAGADLDDLTDVNAPTPANGEVLTWDSTPGEWVAAALPAATVPQTQAGASDTLAAGDLDRLTMYSEAAAVTVTVPTGTFAAGDWFLLQPLGAGGLSLSTVGITVNGATPMTAVAQNEGLMIVFTAANTISVFGGTA